MVHESIQLSHARKFLRPLILKWRVRPAPREPSVQECVKQMTDVMSCWKKNTFDDQKCLKEIALFKACADESRKNRLKEKAKGMQKVKGGQYYWHHTEVNERLQKFSKPQ